MHSTNPKNEELIIFLSLGDIGNIQSIFEKEVWAHFVADYSTFFPACKTFCTLGRDFN